MSAFNVHLTIKLLHLIFDYNNFTGEGGRYYNWMVSKSDKVEINQWYYDLIIL